MTVHGRSRLFMAVPCLSCCLMVILFLRHSHFGEEPHKGCLTWLLEFAFYQWPSGFQVSLLDVVRCCKILSSIGTEPQIALFVYLLSLFHRKCWVHFAVLSVSSLCTDEQSVADVAEVKDRTGVTHLQLCPAIGVSSSNCSLDMEYRSRDMLNHVCVCMLRP